MKQTTALLCVTLGLLAFVGPQARAQVGALIVQDAWARKAPGSDVAAVYLNLRNASAQPIIVVAVKSPGTSSVLIHETYIKGGQSKMRPQDRLVIAPGQTVAFEPGGKHLMLTGITRNYTIGQTVPLIFLLANGQQVQVAAVVRPLDAY